MKGDQSSGGTLMSDHVGLGEADANARWIGVRRHQAALVILGIGLVGSWVMSARAPLFEIVAGVALLIAAAPAFDSLTMGEVAVVFVRYCARSRWFIVSALEFGGDVQLWASDDVAFRGYELLHRGRLDLSGRDVTNAEALTALADAASAAKSGQHFCEHVIRDGDVATTLLSLPVDVPAPDGWVRNNELARRVIGLGDDSESVRLLERFTYLRSIEQLTRVYRVRDFSSVPSTRGLLEQVLRSVEPLDVALHVDVVGSAKAHRVAQRAVHRVGSDDATSRAAGFRRTARSLRNYERLAQREALVASGRSLLRIAVFVVIRATTLDDLQRRSAAVWRHAHDAGVRLERGWGLQAQWYRAQLPGGVGW